MGYLGEQPKTTNNHGSKQVEKVSWECEKFDASFGKWVIII